MKTLKTNADYAALFNDLLKAAEVSSHELNHYLSGNYNYPKPGFYQLKDKSFQAENKYGQEAGVYIAANYYIDLDALNGWKKDLTAAQTLVWAEMEGYQIPSAEELKLIEPVLKEVNEALSRTGMAKHILPDNYLNRCWSQEALEQAKGTTRKRRLIVIKEQENLPEILPFLAKIKSQFKK